MKKLLPLLLLASFPAWPQAAPPAASSVLTCPQCGVVSSVAPRIKETAQLEEQSDLKPSGLVAQIPLDGGKPRVGGSQRIGREAVMTETVYQAVVRLNDGRYQLVLLDSRGDWQPGDRVKIENGRLQRR